MRPLLTLPTCGRPSHSGAGLQEELTGPGHLPQAGQKPGEEHKEGDTA